MISEEKIKYDKDIFSEKEMDLTQEELDKLFNSEETFYKSGKLIMKPRVEKQDKIKELETKLDQSANLNEVKNIIKEIIKL